MTLTEFVATKPKELRLGQHFYNMYWKLLKPEHNTRKDMNFLFYTTNISDAVLIIKEIMKVYQWEELPDV